MEFQQVVEQCRAVREYLPTPVEVPLIRQLLATAALAPSAMNLQPWSFAIITGVVTIDAHARRAREYALAIAPTMDTPAREFLSDPAVSIFYHAPALVLVLASSDEAQAREDCCLAAQNFMLAARAAGLGTCWVGFARPWLNLPQTKRELGLPAGCHVVAPIVLGHPRAWPPARQRRPPEIQVIT
jgi:nitroreductase